jgi:antibiotic biosynthesis monooxygenase (ABM) superfamily enzyme
MYGTVARMKVKAGAEEQFMALMGQYGQFKIPGYRGSLAYRMDADPREVYLSVVFDSKEDYDRNADSPEQDARYREMLGFLEAEPEWHDGAIMSDANFVRA